MRKCDQGIGSSLVTYKVTSEGCFQLRLCLASCGEGQFAVTGYGRVEGRLEGVAGVRGVPTFSQANFLSEW